MVVLHRPVDRGVHVAAIEQHVTIVDFLVSVMLGVDHGGKTSFHGGETIGSDWQDVADDDLVCDSSPGREHFHAVEYDPVLDLSCHPESGSIETTALIEFRIACALGWDDGIGRE